ncbi:zinc-binding dehydrogenase [Nonomuraea sp. NPDC005983]|uniref:zinc-binding dehydrogenase n=1 Tax=Nonomuraea sp. NPDC005983 TaxID=3155595 RepID=UPI0033B00607
MDTTMRAAVAERPGPPEVLRVMDVPLPRLRPGWTSVQVRAFGVNRSELMTRQGHSPGARFPRILGIECVGIVAQSAALRQGTTVAAVMGEMGRAFDGGYAEYALLPDSLLIPLTTTLDWATLGAIPQAYLTALGSLAALAPADGGVLLVRGGSSSVGLAALSLARDHGLRTIATTRNPAKAGLLLARGAGHVVVGQDRLPVRPDYILDLVGASTVAESLRLVAPGGTVCVAGTLGGAWTIPDFEPVAMIPSGTKLTAFHSDDLRGPAGAKALQQIVDGVAEGRYDANLDRVFTLDEIADAHRYMEANQATGKVVVRL